MHIASILDRSNYKNRKSIIRLLKGRGNVFKGNVSVSDVDHIQSSYFKGDVNIGKHSLIENSLLIGNILVGHDCKIKGSHLSGNITIGNYTSIWGPDISIYQSINPIRIGSFCSIAKNVSFQEYNHNTKKITTFFIGQNLFKEEWDDERTSKGMIDIGNDVWIGNSSIILSGAQVGNGCIIAAKAVVNKSYPDYSIIAGVPGKVIGYRFDPEVIEELKKISWWNWSKEKIRKNKFLFKNELTKELLKSIK